jgi:hypothetical protein
VNGYNELFKRCMTEAQDIIDGVSLFDLRSSAGAKKETNTKLLSLMTRYKELQDAALKRAQGTEEESV